MFVPKKLINLFIVFLIFPSGIGLSFMENNLDVNKITYLFCLLLTLVFWYRNSSILTRYDLIPIIIILSILPFSVFWLDNLQYLIFFLNIVLFFSSYYVARIIFINEESAFFFIERLSLFCLIIGLLAILDFYINFLPLEYLRPNAISYLHEYSRGSVGSSLMLIAYKGFFAHTHFFAIERFIWMSLSLTLFIYYKREGKASTFSNVLLLSALLGLIEIFLSQTRFLSLFSLLIFFIAFLKQPNRTWSYLAIFFSFPLLIYLFTTETFNYYYLAISTIFDSGIQNDTGKVISYVLVNDKRYQALAAIFNNLADYRIYFSYGPLFFNYSTELHGVNTEVFDDLTLIILSLLEYGILAYFLCILFVIRILMLKGLKFKKYINFILIVTILSSASTYYPRLMFYVFFFLGAGYSLSLAVNQIKKNHKPQKF